MVDVDGAAVFVGSATFDAIALVPSLPGRDERVVADALVLAGGGPAATAAVAYARLGLPAYFVGTVGDDDEGVLVRRGLETEGVDTSGLAVVSGSATGASVITVEHAHATRTICTRPAPPPTIVTGSRGDELLRSARWVHVDHLGWPAVGDVGIGPGARLSLDAGNPVVGLDLSRVHLYAPTAAGLSRDLDAPPDATLEDLLRSAVAAGPSTVVATRGAAGSVAVAADGTRADTPGLTVDVVSTLGAGDVFHGALLVAVVRGMPLAHACAYAGAVAALSCRGLDGRSAIPDHETALAHMATVLDEQPADPSSEPPTLMPSGRTP